MRKEELLKREILEEEERIEQERRAEERRKEEEQKARRDRGNIGGSTVPEEDRMVKVRWIREGLDAQLDKDRLSTLFSGFGKIESAFLLMDKKQRIGELGSKQSGKKQLMATGIIGFASIAGAHTAMQDTEKQKGDEWDAIYSVAWAKGQAPDFASTQSETTTLSSESKRDSSAEPHRKAPRNLYNFPGLNIPASNPLGPNKTPMGKAPSFASFSSANATSQKQTTTTDKPLSGPSFEEITLARLSEAAHNAEKKKLEEQLREEDEKADAAERESRVQ
ncbi:hypothetical protein KEM56_006665 [Ascosphaera pollenicola]|nr:hypothetical protein KEM56_006665 [Ascosphaera pollenicola]